MDFKPTILGLLGLPADAGDEGRDASALFLEGGAPRDWQDVAFSRNAGGNWLMAASRRHKFVVFTDSDPCLFDLDADPLEMKNLFSSPESRETVRALGRALAEYARRCKDPHAEQPALRADIAWAADGGGAYAPPQRQAARAGAKKRRAGGDDE